MTTQKISTYAHREESVNTALAMLLTEHGVDAQAESIHQSGKQRPDVMMTMSGVRIIIEGKYETVPNAQVVVLADANGRVNSGICQIAVALVYPDAIRTTSTGELQKVLSETSLNFAVISDVGQTEWAQATPTGLLDSLRRVHQSLLQDDLVDRAAQGLSERIETIAALWTGQTATCDRLSTLLGMSPHKGEKNEERDARRITATKVAALVLANAMIFQQQLAISGSDSRVHTLSTYQDNPDPLSDLKSHWNFIWRTINFVPIFQIGESVITEIPTTPLAISSIRYLIKQAQSICANQSALRHDLMGRIYHWLLHQAKYLGTYYTSTSSATLLLKLTFAQKWNIDFGNPKELENFTAVDLACGTGTLLMATAQAMTDQFVVSRVKSNSKLADTDMKGLHRVLMENVLYGYDVLPTAVHLTASTLGMLAPSVTYRKMNLFVMPMGVEGSTLRLGSLDFIDRARVSTQLTLDNSEMRAKQTSTNSSHDTEAEVPMMDLCVMNPPFVRSVGGNLLFGSLHDDERAKLQTELKFRVKDLQGSITAGLGSVFMAIADKYLRVGGRMAFILPVALATGQAWGQSRKLLADRYHVEMVFVSHDIERPNFSENTDLSEIMFIAKKRHPNEQAGPTIYVNLWVNPTAIYDAMDIANRVRTCIPATLDGNTVTSATAMSGRKLADIVALPPTTGENQWTGVQFAQVMTLRSAVDLGCGRFTVPGSQHVSVPLCKLENLGEIGYDRRDMHDAFEVTATDWSPYPAFWNHDSTTVVTIKQKSNAFLLARDKAAKGRKLKAPDGIAKSAGTILLIERLRTNTHRVIAVGFDDPMLGNTWWALQTKLSPLREKALLLWLNSTPSLMLVMSHRVTTQGAWMQVKKPQWQAMPVLDVRALPDETLTKLATAYDSLCDKELIALGKLGKDPVRAEIDDALSVALGLPNIKPLRQLLAREPGLTGVGLSRKPEQQSLLPDVETESIRVPTQMSLL